MAQWSVKVKVGWNTHFKVEAANPKQAKKIATDKQNWVMPKSARDDVQITDARLLDHRIHCFKASKKGETPIVYYVKVYWEGNVEVETTARDARTAESLARRLINSTFTCDFEDVYGSPLKNTIHIQSMWLPRKLTPDTVEDVLDCIEDDNTKAIESYNYCVEEEKSRLVRSQAKFILDGIKKLKDAKFPVETPVGKAADHDDLIRKLIARKFRRIKIKAYFIAEIFNRLPDIFSAIATGNICARSRKRSCNFQKLSQCGKIRHAHGLRANI